MTKRKRSDTSPPDTTGLRKKAMAEALAETGNVKLACEMAGVGRSTHYDWLKADAEYHDTVVKAMEDAADVLEAEARRRAVDGVQEPVGFYQGRASEYVRKYSDTLLIFLLKGARPEKYREHSQVEHTGGVAIHVIGPRKPE